MHTERRPGFYSDMSFCKWFSFSVLLVVSVGGKGTAHARPKGFILILVLTISETPVI